MIGIGTLMSIGFRLMSHRGEIEKLIPEVISKGKQISDLVNKIAPELIPPELQQLAGRMAPQQQVKYFEPKYDMRWLQESLNKLTELNIPVDGQYGDRTKAAVKAFQERHALEPDGWAGVKTEAKIWEELEKKGLVQ